MTQPSTNTERFFPRPVYDPADPHTFARAWDGTGIPARFKTFTLQSSPRIEDVPQLLETNPEDSWFFHGPHGTGKTGLAVGLARVAVEQGWIVRFVTVPEMLGKLRSTYNRNEGPTEQQIIDRYTSSTILILDDLGAEQVKDTGWLEDRLYQIIGKRHDELRPTIFTSNLSIAQLATRIGDRITWRMVEMVGPEHIVELKGRNLRDQ